MSHNSKKAVSVGHEPYRSQPLRPPERPRRTWRRVLVTAALLALVIVVPLYCGGGFYHLPARASVVCALSPNVGERFSLWRFRALSAAVHFQEPMHHSASEVTWSALGTWLFLRCSCRVHVERGLVTRKSIHCFD